MFWIRYRLMASWKLRNWIKQRHWLWIAPFMISYTVIWEGVKILRKPQPPYNDQFLILYSHILQKSCMWYYMLSTDCKASWPTAGLPMQKRAIFRERTHRTWTGLFWSLHDQPGGGVYWKLHSIVSYSYLYS